MTESKPATGALRLSMVFREFRKGDEDAVYFLQQKYMPPPAQQEYGSLMITVLNKDAGTMVIEVTDENHPELQRVIGALIVRTTDNPPTMAVDSLVIEPVFRRRGLGKKLMAWACRAAIISGHDELLAFLDEGNHMGEAFLKDFGFVPSPSREKIDDEARPGHQWEKKLEQKEKHKDSSQESSNENL